MVIKILSLFFKLVERFSSYGRGFLLKIKVILLGGECQGIPKVGPFVYWKYPPHKGIKISRNVDIGPGCYFDIPPMGSLLIGENVKITGGVYISSLNSVAIGDNSLIAEYCSLRDSEHLTSSADLINNQGMSSSDICVGEDVWLCKGVTVLKGVSLARGTVVGAHSLIKNIKTEEYSIYAGVPAKKIKERTVT